jgi:hypothetical protein
LFFLKNAWIWWFNYFIFIKPRWMILLEKKHTRLLLATADFWASISAGPVTMINAQHFSCPSQAQPITKNFLTPQPSYPSICSTMSPAT